MSDKSTSLFEHTNFCCWQLAFENDDIEEQDRSYILSPSELFFPRERNFVMRKFLNIEMVQSYVVGEMKSKIQIILLSKRLAALRGGLGLGCLGKCRIQSFMWIKTCYQRLFHRMNAKHECMIVWNSQPNDIPLSVVGCGWGSFYCKQASLLKAQ